MMGITITFFDKIIYFDQKFNDIFALETVAESELITAIQSAEIFLIVQQRRFIDDQ